MRLLIDMNLSPLWVSFFERSGISSVHWSTVGACDAPDVQLFEFARLNGYMIFTNDLDFGVILSHTKASAPSVIQVRAQVLTPDSVGETVVSVLKQFHAQLEQGAIVTILPKLSKVRILPL